MCMQATAGLRLVQGDAAEKILDVVRKSFFFSIYFLYIVLKVFLA